MNKQVFWVIVLVAVIAVSVGLAVKRHRDAGRMPKEMRSEEITMVDENTLEVFRNTRENWAKHTPRNGRSRNPKTGEYTLRVAMTCHLCNELIPGMVNDTPLPYMCPKCGKQVFPAPGMRGPGMREPDTLEERLKELGLPPPPAKPK